MTNKGKDIRNEIREVAPGLGTLGSSPDFSVPGGYFEEFPGKLMARIHAMEASEAVTAELAEVSPLLAAAPRQSPFSVPDNYFESLTREVSDRKFEGTPGRVVKMSRRLRLYKKCLVAAAIAGAVSVGAVLLSKQFSTNSLDKQIAQLSDQEIIDYLQFRTDAFDTESIFANAVLDDDTDNMPDIALPEELSTEEIDAILEENLLKDVPFN
ncbi:hypothetical protein [Chitinophaga cymbidii]|uniref:Uncharacterized protein n=1 Tax=Chitinophaga cymbidii TaxID=1096750 RepID=A0A512RIW3_9BACT|nr:hypothetical protein [Chitinophaga cymbidii]GEP95628.1 hypothetical protein CCY01nite_18880 [Chitinophaga cymbidii]